MRKRHSLLAVLVSALAFGAAAAAAPTQQAAPAVTGSVVVGEVLSAATGTWAAVGALAFSYDWQRCTDPADEGTCSSVGAASAASYTVASADLGNAVRVVVTATDDADPGNPVSAASAPTAAVRGVSTSSLGSALSVADAVVDEGNAGTTELRFVVALSRASGATVTVSAATTDGTAAAASDYEALARTVTFYPGELAKTVTVSVRGDTTVEADETLTLTLSSAANASLDDATASGTIRNDDAAPVEAPASAGAAAAAGVVQTVLAVARAGLGIQGGDGDDRLDGTGAADDIRALGGDDLVRGLAGNDTVDAGPGGDTVFGGAGHDVVLGGAGADRIVAGAGDDRIDAADGERDVVNCGAGRDRVTADWDDALTGCELVTRR